MKRLAAFLFLLAPILVFSQPPRNYYFAASGNDNTGNGSLHAPYRTLAKLDAIARVAGDSIFFNRGDEFYGKTILRAGDVYTGANGQGKKPVLGSFVTLSGWTSAGRSLYEASLSAGARLNVVSINGMPQARGRYPNAGTWIQYQGHSKFDVVYANPYTGIGNWDSGGTAEISIRSVRWMQNTYPVVKQHKGDFQYNGDQQEMQVEPSDYNSFFIQNDPRTLDRQNEWFYYRNLQKLRIFSLVPPSSLTVRVATADTILQANNKNNITIDGVDFRGCNQIGLFFMGGDNIRIRNCKIDFTGSSGLYCRFTSHLLVEYDTLQHIYFNALDLGPVGTNPTVRFNYIRDVGQVRGEGRNGNMSRAGIFIATTGTNALVTHNKLSNIGYYGIAATGSNMTVSYNVVDSATSRYDDGGGIYTWDAGTNRRIVGNVVTHTIGNVEGVGDTIRLGEGIYADEAAENVLIDSNTVAYSSDKGMYCHDARNITITNNLFYESGQHAIALVHDNLQPNIVMKGFVIKHNILVSLSKRPSRVPNARVDTTNSLLFLATNKTDKGSLRNFGIADSNQYIKPFSTIEQDYFKVSYRQIPAGTSVAAGDSDRYRTYDTYRLRGWRATFGQDIHSTQKGAVKPFTFSDMRAEMYPPGDFSNGIKDVVLNPNSSFSTTTVETGRMDGACLKVSYTGSHPETDILNVWFRDANNLQTLLAGHTYRVSFDIVNSIDREAEFYCRISSDFGASPDTDTKLFKVDGTRKHMEFAFIPANNITSHYVLIYSNSAAEAPVFYVDNFSLREATVRFLRPEDYIRLEYATESPKIYKAVQPYADSKGVAVGASGVIPPRRYMLMFRNPEAGKK